MQIAIEKVEPLPGHKLKLRFEGGENRIFDVSPFLDKGVFKELKDEAYYKNVKVGFSSVYWPNEQDFSSDTLYALSKTIESRE